MNQVSDTEYGRYDRRRERVGLFVMAAFFLFPTVLIALFYAWFAASSYEVGTPTQISIREGDGFLAISRMLAERGILRNASLFRLYVLMRGWAGSLRPGTYTFSGSVTPVRVARMLVAGPGDVSVTIPEGFTVFDIDKRLAEFGVGEQGEITALSNSPELFSFAFLRNEDIRGLEGFLFPDTYRFDQKTGAKEAVEKMLANFERRVVSDLGEEVRANPSLLSVVTLASLIEKEVADSEGRRIVSGILWRRLELGMPLQVDASVIYAWKLLNPLWKPKGFALSASELKINSPYNTYRVKGLPPAPISNPGLDALFAALHPADSAYWYYLSTPGGKTVFSETLEAHNAAKAKYLR